jgi:integrase
MHNDFTVFLREYPNGKKVFFYYAYDRDGVRRGPWTTKSLTKTAARNYCNALLRSGGLIPDKKPVITFGELAEGFWDRSSIYITRQESRADITDTYLINSKRNLANQIMPYFKDTPLDKITEDDVNNWLLGFKNRTLIKNDEPVVMHYKNTYANGCLTTINVMLAEAKRRGLIPINPSENVKKLKNDSRDIEILTPEEVQKLFPKAYKTIWGDKKIAYVANRLASLTGMRIGEILGLKCEYVFDDYIRVCGQYGEFGYQGHTKTKENRNIPLMPDMIAQLRKLMASNGKGFVFSQDGGATPVTNSYVRWAFNKALNNIGIDSDEIKRRSITLHSWRHFVNTDLLRQGFSIQQVQSVTGHKSEKMTQRYNHPDARLIADVVEAQSKIAGKKKPAKSKTKQAKKEKGKDKDLKIVKMPIRKTA